MKFQKIYQIMLQIAQDRMNKIHNLWQEQDDKRRELQATCRLWRLYCIFFFVFYWLTTFEKAYKIPEWKLVMEGWITNNFSYQNHLFQQIPNGYSKLNVIAPCPQGKVGCKRISEKIPWRSWIHLCTGLKWMSRQNYIY